MDIKQEIDNLPRALAETLTKGQPEYEVVLRRTRWGEGPIYLLGSGTSRYACFTGIQAFETLVGWPAVARSLSAFATYSTGLLRPGAVVIAVSPCCETSAMLEVGRAAGARGASLLILTNQPESASAKIAAGVLRLWTEGEGSSTIVCEQAAMSCLGLLAARIFKKHQPQFEVLEEEFRRLPGEIGSVLHRMSDALNSLACELAAFRRIYVLGGGAYYPSALQAEHLLQGFGYSAQAVDPMEFGSLAFLERNAVLLAVSSSRCRAKKRIYEEVKRAGKSGVKIVSVTDSNDRELAELSALAVFLPDFSELVGAVLTSVLIHWLAHQTARQKDSGDHGTLHPGGFGRGQGSRERSFRKR